MKLERAVGKNEKFENSEGKYKSSKKATIVTGKVSRSWKDNSVNNSMRLKQSLKWTQLGGLGSKWTVKYWTGPYKGLKLDGLRK